MYIKKKSMEVLVFSWTRPSESAAEARKILFFNYFATTWFLCCFKQVVRRQKSDIFYLKKFDLM